MKITLRILLIFMVLGTYGENSNRVVASESDSVQISAEKAIQRLQDGNQRYAEGKRIFPYQDMARIRELVEGQHPFVTMISCSDSRVPPEHLFDCGLGEIFTIRVPGNVCDTDEIGAIEYGIDHLQTPLLVVLGHTRCGAVTAVVQQSEMHGNISELVDNIIPAVEKARQILPDRTGDSLISEAVRFNIWQSIEDLLNRSKAARERVKSDRLQIVGAVYHLENGKVEWLGAHPKEKELLSSHRESESAPGFIHSVYFYLDENATAAQKEQLIEDCKSLLGSIKTVRHLIVGVPAGTPRDVVDNSYGVNLTVFFDGVEGHDYYQKAEEHLQFIERNKKTWKRVRIYDTIPR